MYFIDKIATYIFEQNLDLEHLTIILPSQRAKKYLQKALYEKYNKPIFSPVIITMNSWVQDLSPLPIIDKTRALFKLYAIHQSIDKEAQSFDEFLKWGNILLNDFDELNRYLIDSNDLFKNLKDIKVLEAWNFDSEESMTEGQKQFMQFWDTLKDYYEAFNKKLNSAGECYMGMAYRALAENIDRVFKTDKNRQFIFAGFNALSPTETSIIKQLHKMGRAMVFVDGDEIYVKDKNHEAGRFIRDFLADLQVNSLPFIENNIQNSTKKISIINVPQRTGQAKISATLLDNIPQNEYADTLLLLADEQLIVPVIKNIPQKVGKANITLGLPLKHTALKSWVELLFTIQEHFIQFRSNNIYHKDFIRLIKHPFLFAYCNEEEKRELAKIEAQILNYNWMFIFLNNIDVSEPIKVILRLVFTKWDNNILEVYQTLNRLLFGRIDNEANAIEKAIIYHFDRALKRFEPIFVENRNVIDALKLATLKILFNQHWMNESISYYGNPLDGLQVMGLLETRLIDFKNIIIIGLNEGSLPPTNPIQTIIPMDLRKYHGLPTPREKQGLFAHHFYRLLHHAEKCWITYSSADKDLGGVDEPSRYILQLELELSRRNPNITIVREDYSVTDEAENTNELRVIKDQVLFERMDAYFLQKTSATALRNALHCPLDFYYRFLLGLGEEKMVEEEMEANTFGSIIHSTLEDFFKPFTPSEDDKGTQIPARPLTAYHIDEMLGNLKQTIRKYYDTQFGNHLLEGKNYLSIEIAEYLTKRYLNKEKTQLNKENAHFFVIGTEVEVKKQLFLKVNGIKKEINFVGYIDRIDKVGNQVRIIDYKTGKCDLKQVTLSSRKKLEKDEDKIAFLVYKLKESKYLLQLLLYNMFFYEQYHYYPDKTGIISFVNLNESPFFLDNQITNSMDELMVLFEQALVQILKYLYDPSIPFEHNIESKYCNYCLS